MCGSGRLFSREDALVLTVHSHTRMGERERERQVERKRSVSSPCGQSCLPTRRRAPIPRCTNGSPGSFFFFLFFFSFSVLTKVEITSRLQTFCSTLISRCNQVYTCLPEFRVNLWDVGQTCFFSPGNPLETGRILWRCFEFRLGRTKKNEVTWLEFTLLMRVGGGGFVVAGGYSVRIFSFCPSWLIQICLYIKDINEKEKKKKKKSTHARVLEDVGISAEKRWKEGEVR